MPPQPDPASAAGLPTAPPPHRRRWALPVVLVIGVGITAGMVYAGLHPVRLIVQAHNVGLAPKTFRASYVAKPPNEYDSPVPGTDADTAGDGFPYDAPLPDGHRRIVLVFPQTPYDAARFLQVDPRNGKLYLLSADAAGKPCIAAFPAGMDSLAGVTEDHRILAAHLRLPASTADVNRAENSGARKPQIIELTRVGVLDNATPAEKLRVVAPRSGAVTEIAISPSGQRLLWAVSFSRTPNPVVVWAARYWKALDRFAETRPAIGVYVTGLHGENPVRLGEETAERIKAPLPAKPAASDGTSAATDTPPMLTLLPAHLRWEPDGKSIRFACGENDYTMALDGR